jgi:hypothetical protein
MDPHLGILQDLPVDQRYRYPVFSFPHLQDLRLPCRDMVYQKVRRLEYFQRVNYREHRLQRLDPFRHYTRNRCEGLFLDLLLGRDQYRGRRFRGYRLRVSEMARVAEHLLDLVHVLVHVPLLRRRRLSLGCRLACPRMNIYPPTGRIH